MTIEEKMAGFMETAVEYNTKTAEQELAAYAAELERQFLEHKNAVDANAVAEIASETDAIRRECNRKTAHEELVLKRSLSMARSQFTDRVFAEVDQLVEAFRHTEDYEKLLLSQITEAAKVGRRSVLTIFIDPEDAPLKERLEQESGISLTISPESFGGGTRTVIESRHILIDQSFVAKLAELRENFSFTGGENDGN